MIFSSPVFLFAFCPVFFIVLFCIPRTAVWAKNVWIIIGSLLFYAWGAGTFIVVVLGTLVLDYFFGRVIAQKGKYCKLFVTADVAMNLGILLYFKYFNFFLENLNAVFSRMGIEAVSFASVALPLGVSFVVFQKMTYCLDIARGNSKPAEHYFYLVEYLLLFPQIVAGPIVKYSEIATQIKERLVGKEDFLYGFRRFSLGLFKKVWIADVVAQTADTVFLAQATQLVPIDYAWLGALAYSFQIFFDFSAYSDMAIGMLAIMGFHIGENFNQPYTAFSVTDFWKRWHISMTSWFREYLYIPLGGNRKGKVRTYLNLWIVFLLSGFWHGAAWNFIFWGAYHGLLLCIERGGLLKRLERVPAGIRVAGTFFLAMIGWIFFRVDTIGQGFSYVANLFNPASYTTHLASQYILTIDPREWFIFALAAVICFLPAWKKAYAWMEAKARSFPALCRAGTLLLFFLSAMKVITGAISPFIYFWF
ncbi:MAG: MBOAT family protein [Oscillospiraceae bacterium]|nr:MBOAT family protein [Oscillospiraceae bacterium]